MDILTIFIKNPEKEFSVREVARAIKVAPTTASLRLLECKKQGILISRDERNYILYKANLANKDFLNRKLFYNIQDLYDCGLLDHLLDFYNEPSAIILFGSYRKAQDTPASDIDLCIITPLKKEPDLSAFEKKVRHKIQLFLLSKAQIKQIPTPLLNNILNGIVLEGFVEVFP